MNKANFLQRAAAWLIVQAVLSIIYSPTAVAIGLTIGAYSSGIRVPNLILAPSVIVFSIAPAFGLFFILVTSGASESDQLA